MSLIPWQPVNSTSCAQGTSLDHIIQSHAEQVDTIDEEMMWESSKESSYQGKTQEIVVRLGQRASLTAVEL